MNARRVWAVRSSAAPPPVAGCLRSALALAFYCYLFRGSAVAVVCLRCHEIWNKQMFSAKSCWKKKESMKQAYEICEKIKLLTKIIYVMLCRRRLCVWVSVRGGVCVWACLHAWVSVCVCVCLSCCLRSLLGHFSQARLLENLRDTLNCWCSTYKTGELLSSRMRLDESVYDMNAAV